MSNNKQLKSESGNAPIASINNGRTISDVIKEDKGLARIIEINIEFLDLIKTVKNVDIHHLTIRDGKVLLEGKKSVLVISDK